MPDTKTKPKPKRTVIVGAGISGLYVALTLVRRGDAVTVLDSSESFGGRVATSSRGYEIGAGRVCECHSTVQGLLTQYNLHLTPIKSGLRWISVNDPKGEESNYFYKIWPTLLHSIRRLPSATLATHTLKQLLVQTFGKRSTEELLNRFEYRTEVESMRADVALRIFTNEMSGTHQYYSVREGLSAVIAAMVREIRSSPGCMVLPRRRVQHVARSGHEYLVQTNDRDLFAADQVVMAVSAKNLRSITPFMHLKALRHIGHARLTRIYAEYPTPWLSEKYVTDSPLRYVIPVSPKWVMISYTDGRDTAHWDGLQGRQLTKEITKEQRRLWPSSPSPSHVSAYPWHDAASFWIPGTYDPEKVSVDLEHPFPSALPNVWITGELLSVTRQAWMEGALNCATRLLMRI